MNGNQGPNNPPVELPAVTLERRLYARIDEVFAPINGELDAVNTRLTALAAQYEALSERLLPVTTEANPLGRSAIYRIDAVETRVADAHRRCDALASVNERNDSGISALRSVVEQVGKAVQSLAERVEDLEVSHPSVALRAKLEELTHALEDHVHAKNGDAVLADESPPPIYLGDVAFRQEFGPSPVRATPGVTAPEVDTYEVDGRPATRAEYEAAENDPQAPHTTRHVHRPFSDGATGPVHDFLWAVRQMKGGVKAREVTWAHGAYCRFSSNGVLVLKCVLNEESEPNFTASDLLSTNWELV